MKNWIKATLVFLGIAILVLSIATALAYGFTYYNYETIIVIALGFSIMMIKFIKNIYID